MILKTHLLASIAESCAGIESDSDNAGSGMVIAHVGSNSYVLTCQHVVGPAKTKVEVVWRVGKKFLRQEGVVERSDLTKDLAIVRTSKRITAPAIAIADWEPPLYSPVAAIGCPDGLFGTISTGLLTGADGSNGKPDMGYQLSGMFVIGGYSGGGLVNLDGELIGIITSTYRAGADEAPGIAFAAQREEVLSFLRRDSATAVATKRARAKRAGAARDAG